MAGDQTIELIMKTAEPITTQSGLPLQVETRVSPSEVEVVFKTATHKKCLLHWGVRQPAEKEWRLPPQSLWPAESRPVGKNAVQSPFVKENGETSLVIHVSPPTNYASLDFVLYFPEENRWDNNQGRNYQIALTQPAEGSTTMLGALRALAGEDEVTFERTFELGSLGQLAVTETKRGDRYHIFLLSDIPGKLALHWGIARHSPHEWLTPPASLRGPDTILWQEHTAQTLFTRNQGFNSVHLEFAQAEAPLGIQFVLRQTEDGGRWINYRGGNFYVPIHVSLPKPVSPGMASFTALADETIRAEMGHNSWTLMHRFNLCHDLLERVRHDVDGLALVYVWLRFSAIRQLTWQRNYNTKPRELAHAQDRLTRKLAEIYQAEPAARMIVRLMLVTVGRGGEGQQIRDEILNIMHRRHIKETSGHFLEEWHQKLHNNTTPDDIVICEAFLEFLRNNGNQDAFYKTLEAGGVTRQRLESFERPIRSTPQFLPYHKDGLIHDFQYFLKILKASHSGTDLETAINATRNRLGDHLQGLLDYLWQHRNDPNEPLVQLVGRLTEARRLLQGHLQGGDNLREKLYLDLALEQLMRAAVERNIHLRLNGDQLTELINRVLENMMLSSADAEMSACWRHWERLQPPPHFSAEWSLNARSVMERVTRALGVWIDHFYQLFQPKAEYLGKGFRADSWAITLFSEEVVRGGSLGFILSMLTHHLDPLLRKAANVGDWQIISRGQGAGKIEVVSSLLLLQREHFDHPTVVVADKVMGSEEIPANVTAVIAPDVTDIVSHVAVRARNLNVLFAACLNPTTFQHLKSRQGQFIKLDVNLAGDITVSEGDTATAAPPPIARAVRKPLAVARFTKYAIGIEDFNEQTVGGKSCNLNRLRNQLPEWIHLPASVALPFGILEKVLKLDANQAAARRYQEIYQKVETDGEATLAGLREAVLALEAPEELPAALHDVMNVAGLPWPEDWAKTWNRIKQVWASKWNERAFMSRKRMGFPHEHLFMAVLIQQVVPADYAFVIHTVNPTNNNRDELYAEVVLGLGETLVGNHPGRAFRFVCHKATGHQTVLAYPSKSHGLYGRGLIFRSDSNGEDLAGYAGAGLYDSLLLEPPAEKTLDYSQEPLIWAEDFRRDLMASILRIGLEIERVTGSPQDIEGAVAQGKYYVVQTRPQAGVEKET